MDLKLPEAQAALHRLVSGAVFSSPTIRCRSGPRLGIDHNTLAALNARLIYGSFTAYGEVGDEAEKTGFDFTAYWARWA